MVSPRALPVSQSQLSIASTAFRTFLARLSSSIRHGFSQCRPWSELVQGSSISRPETLSEALSRIRKNLSYFRINYIFVIALLLTISLVSHPFSFLLLLCLLSAWLFLYTFRSSDQPLVLLGRTFSDQQVLGILILSTIIVIFITSIASILISTVLVGFAVICFHGAFRAPEDLFLNDQDSVNTVYIPFLGAAAPTLAGRVVV